MSRGFYALTTVVLFSLELFTPGASADWTLNIVVTGSGSTSPAEGMYSYADATAVNVEASLGISNWAFDHWEGDIEDNDPSGRKLTLRMTENRTVTAVYVTPADYTLNVSFLGIGSTLPASGVYGVKNNTTIGVTAIRIRNSGYAFAHWSGDLAAGADTGAETQSILMDQNRSVVAEFVPGDYTLAISNIAGGGTGEITPSPGVYSFLSGQNADIKAELDSGMFWGGWSGDITGYDFQFSLLIDNDKSITPKIAATGYYLTLTVNDSGLGQTQPQGTIGYMSGASPTIKAIPASGATFAHWAGDLGPASPNNPEIQVTMNQLRNLTATFEPLQSVVPDLSGLTEEQAQDALSSIQLVLGSVNESYSATVGAGLVITQDPLPGNGLTYGSSVDITISLGVGSSRRYVDEDAVGSSDGLTWDTAFHSIQEGVDAAFAAGGGEVWVAEGTYTSASNPVVTMKENVHLYGGFAGTETARDQRDWKAHVTTIDGENARRGVNGANNATLNGFTITRGQADGGGGMFNDSVAPEVRNCVFSNNTAGGGGGMANWMSSPTIRNCVFSGNVANADSSYGGGILNISESSNIAECLFEGNTAGNGAGFCSCIASVSVHSCVFLNNESGQGGCFYIGPISVAKDGEPKGTSSMAITNCLFFENTSGAITLDIGPLALTLLNCTIAGNAVNGQSGSGGLSVFGGSVIATNCILWNNAGNQVNGETATITYSCIQGGYSGEGNISTDPMFASAEEGDCRLRPGSPCIDAGTTESAPSEDVLGVLRPYGAGIDMGAYEYPGHGAAFEISQASAICDQVMNFTDESVSDPAIGDITSWAWDFGDGAASSEQNPEHAYAAPGRYEVRLTITAGGHTDTASQWVTIGRVWHVDADATGTPDGLTWATAFTSIQEAVDAAFAENYGEVWVAAGTYTSASNPVVTMKENVHLYGGFAGAETALEQRDWNAHVTTLDGENARRGVNGANNATLDGFVITRASVTNENGGGMYNNAVSPLVRNCSFLVNTAVFGAGMANEGGSPRVEDCRFQGNVADYMTGEAHGGGMCNLNGAATQIVGCTFIENECGSKGGGGGIANLGSSPTIAGCRFEANSAQGGGGIYNYADCQIIVEKCVFVANTVSGGGGALSDVDSSSVFANCVFYNNTAQNGGALFLGHGSTGYPCSYEAVNCTFAENQANAQGGCLYMMNQTAASLKNCILWDSDANSEINSDAASVEFSCVQGGFAGEGNIAAEPKIVDPENGDFRLYGGSPCIDAGVTEEAPDMDIRGIPRPQGSGVDMGAYEYFGPTVISIPELTTDPLPVWTWSSDGREAYYRYGWEPGVWLAEDVTDTAYMPPAALEDGSYTLYVQERDAGGIWWDTGQYMVTVDTTPPQAPAVMGQEWSALPRPAWSWTSGGGNGGGYYRYGFAEGDWLAQEVALLTYTPEADLSDGAYTLYVQERDAAGNWSASGSFAIHVDTIAPAAPVITTDGGNGPGVDFATDAFEAVLDGTVTDDAVSVLVNGSVEGVMFTPGATSWSYTGPMAYGGNVFEVQIRDAAGNVSSVTIHIQRLPETTVYVSPEGDDATGTGQSAKPWQTILHAMDTIAPYATAERPITISLAAGVYAEQVVFAPHVRIAGADADIPSDTRIAPPSGAFVTGHMAALRGAEDTAVRDLSIELPINAPANAVIILVEDVAMTIENTLLNGRDVTGSIGVSILSARSSGSVLRDSIVKRVDYGVRAVETQAIITRNRFEDIRFDAVFVRAPESKSEKSTPVVGDAGQPDVTGINVFRNVEGFYIRNMNEEVTKAEICDWGVYTEAEIAAHMSGNVDFVPFLKSALIPSSVAVSVVDVLNDKPITNATISLSPGGLPDVADNVSGVYTYGVVPQGSYTVHAEAAGYLANNVAVSVRSDKIVAVALYLMPVSAEGEGDGGADGEGEGDGNMDGEGEGEGEGGEIPVIHTSDQNGNGRIELSELLRVIQFFNMHGYHCAGNVTSEDGYLPGESTDHACAPHGSDYAPQNWQISLSELLRLIQFFNMGSYHACPSGDTEDGYCPGTA